MSTSTTNSGNSYRGPDGVMRRKPGPPQPQQSQQSKPQPAQSKPDQHPLDCFVGKRITLQRGPVAYVGTLRAITRRWLIFAEAKITAADGRRTTLAEVYINADCGPVYHVHLEQPHDGSSDSQA